MRHTIQSQYFSTVCLLYYRAPISGFLLILLVESVAHKLFGGEGHSHFPAEKRTVTGLANNAFEV